MCSAPYRQGVAEYGCGQCMPCRFNHRRLWAARLMLESQKHGTGFFVTLTYKEDKYPEDGSVSVREAQLFLKRVREAIAPRRLRYFIVGEYGDHTQRAHYHAVLFGDFGEIVIHDAWGDRGWVHVGAVTPESVAYVAGYTVKKMTRKDDARLKGRAPEFARMSLKPGIGAGAMGDIGDVLVTRSGSHAVSAMGDVPVAFRSMGQQWPLGRYLRRKLREQIGMDPAAPGSAVLQQERQAELMVPGARAFREEKREAVGARARVRASIQRSKKGL